MRCVSKPESHGPIYIILDKLICAIIATQLREAKNSKTRESSYDLLLENQQSPCLILIQHEYLIKDVLELT